MALVHTAEFDTPVGSMLCATTEKGLAYVRLPRASGRGFSGWLRRNEPDAEVKPGFAPNQVAIGQILEFLEGKRSRFELALDLRGTDFQLKVLDALLEIPYGETRSYRDVAERIGNPKAVRAVGSANGNNPIALIIPCHRVIGSNGSLTGFGGGLPTKQYLLELELRHSGLFA